MTFFLVLIIPLLVAIGAFIFLKGITWKEFLVHVVAQLLVAGISAGIIFYMDTLDHEVWNGWVTGKQKTWVSCQHSYECNCRNEETCSGSGKDRSCSSSRVCDTCYEHTNDWDWDVFTSNQETITIDRVDRQGVYTPPRWTAVKFLEPTAQKHQYTSYIKAAPDTLFRHQGIKGKYAGRIPQYPGRIYDYYRVDRLVTQGISVDNAQAWDNGLDKINSELGAKKQANMIVVLTDQTPDWYYALEESWIGGKKNDVILVIGMDESGKAAWAQVMCWTTAEIFKIKLRDSIMALPTITPEAVLRTMSSNVSEYYKRKPMADFEYLRASIVPSGTSLTVSIIIGLLIAIGLTYLFQVYDVFEGGTLFRRSWARKGSFGLGDLENDPMFKRGRTPKNPFSNFNFGPNRRAKNFPWS